MTARSLKSNFRVLPLPMVQKDGKKLLTPQQLREGISVAKRLKCYPDVPDLSIGPCGEGMELRIESPAINPQGWLRVIFYVDEKTRTIYIVDLFWKKTNKVTTADLHRTKHRIRNLRAQLAG